MMAGFHFGAKRLLGNYVYGAELSACLRVGLDIICDCLTFVQRLKPFARDSGEVYENIVAAFSVGNKAETLL